MKYILIPETEVDVKALPLLTAVKENAEPRHS